MEYEEKSQFLELVRLNNLNRELLDANHNLLSRLSHECKNHRISLQPEVEALLLRVRQVLEEISGERRNLTGGKADKDLTESASQALNMSTLKYGIGTACPKKDSSQ